MRKLVNWKREEKQRKEKEKAELVLKNMRTRMIARLDEKRKKKECALKEDADQHLGQVSEHLGQGEDTPAPALPQYAGTEETVGDQDQGQKQRLLGISIKRLDPKHGLMRLMKRFLLTQS